MGTFGLETPQMTSDAKTTMTPNKQGRDSRLSPAPKPTID